VEKDRSDDATEANMYIGIKLRISARTCFQDLHFDYLLVSPLSVNVFLQLPRYFHLAGIFEENLLKML